MFLCKTLFNLTIHLNVVIFLLEYMYIVRSKYENNDKNYLFDILLSEKPSLLIKDNEDCILNDTWTGKM